MLLLGLCLLGGIGFGLIALALVLDSFDRPGW